MVELGVFLGLMGVAAAWLVRTLLRRGRRRTENADGLLIELARTAQASSDRSSYNSNAVHNSITHGTAYRP
ncbi:MULTISPECIES: hypothetical protein [Streptomyces]|uniref:Secreted protein n=1 Tax=Streptomyces flavotricini TaxID=66888 RepID=A0ABS8EH71_9ACTN|nr:hypothetical protein [Streptomyces flavotricini]MCC0100497.1 hypothetical protein [Streptomyces flavotricini]